MTTPRDTSVFYNFCSYNETRRRAALTNVPPPRIDTLALSPYPEFTQYELDMRRKVEILKYEANRSTTKTNNFTKSEKWKQLISRSLQARTYTTEAFNNVNGDNVIDISCNLAPTPSTAAGIPGPTIFLQLNTNVPLYSYSTNLVNLGIIENPPETLWDLTTYFDALTYHTNAIAIPAIVNDRYRGNISGSTFITSMYLQNNIDSSYVYSLTSPIGLYALLTKNNAASANLNIDISLNIQEIVFEVKYSGSNVSLQKLPVITPASGFNSMNININTGLPANIDVIASQYVGNLNISDLLLFTEPGYLYDLSVTFKLGFNVPSNLYQYFKSFQLKAIINMKSPSRITSNCVIYNPTPVSGFSAFSLSGE